MNHVICIDSSILGTRAHLIIDDGYRWSSSVPTEAWYLSGKIKLDSDKCFDTLLTLNNVELDFRPSQKYVNAMSQTGVAEHTNLPWQKIMPSKQHKTFVARLLGDICSVLPRISKIYYEATWVPSSHVLRSLKPAHISQRRHREVLDDCDMLVNMIGQFKPDSTGLVRAPSYNRFGTRTGRLVVDAGPNILGLKKSYRDMITPLTKDGHIVSIDFSSLEPRVVLYESGQDCQTPDLYTYVSNELLGGIAKRDVVKLAIISELYGSGRELLEKTLNIHGDELTTFMSKIREVFMTANLKKRLKDEFIKTGYVKNHYDRSIKINEPLDHILMNSYAQSTGVDVALLGFSQLVKKFEHMKGVRPLYVLHDALWLDVEKNCLDAVTEQTQIKIPGYAQEFYVKSEILA